jgi:hypothetical protein
MTRLILTSKSGFSLGRNCSKNSPQTRRALGAAEMRMLELISAGNAGPFDVFPGHRKRNQRRVFGYWEVGCPLDGLAHCPVPAVSGLEEGPFTLQMHDDRNRHERYKRSELKLTPLGEAILARTGTTRSSAGGAAPN